MLIRTEGDFPYTPVINQIFRDTRISYKAIGIFAQMLSVANNNAWNYSEEGMASLHTDGVASIKSGLKELEKYGYLRRNKIRNELGHFDMEYILNNMPTRENPMSENPTSENNTYNKVNSNKLNNIYTSEDSKNAQKEQKQDTDNLQDNSEEKEPEQPEEPKVIDPLKTQVPEVIKQCAENLDPKNTRYYGNTTQRKACAFLIETYGFDQVIKMIHAIPKLKQRVPYFPTITTPVELQDKWQKVLDAIQRVKTSTNTKREENVNNFKW